MVQVLFLVIILSLTLLYGNILWNSPFVAIINRWLRWILFSVLFAYFSKELEWFDKPYFVLAITGFGGWFLIESIYTWFGIRTLNFSSVSLFPKYIPDTQGVNWPNNKHFITLRNWLRTNNFKEQQSLKCILFDTFFIRSSVFYSADLSIRLQIVFLPKRRGNFYDYYILSSKTASGSMVVTDNMFLPYGGFYPNNWFLKRSPLTRSLHTLLKKHQKRMKNFKESFLNWEESVVEQFNEEQQALRLFNMEKGFMLHPEFHFKYGQISYEGRYRLWKEIWMLKYLGLPLLRP